MELTGNPRDFRGVFSDGQEFVFAEGSRSFLQFIAVVDDFCQWQQFLYSAMKLSLVCFLFLQVYMFEFPGPICKLHELRSQAELWSERSSSHTSESSIISASLVRMISIISRVYSGDQRMCICQESLRVLLCRFVVVCHICWCLCTPMSCSSSSSRLPGSMIHFHIHQDMDVVVQSFVEWFVSKNEFILLSAVSTTANVASTDSSFGVTMWGCGKFRLRQMAIPPPLPFLLSRLCRIVWNVCVVRAFEERLSYEGDVNRLSPQQFFTFLPFV